MWRGRKSRPPRNSAAFDDDTVRDYFYKLVEKLELPRIRLHDLRHLHATLMLHEGVDLATVSARLGHASKAFTLHQYVHGCQPVKRKPPRLLTNC